MLSLCHLLEVLENICLQPYFGFLNEVHLDLHKLVAIAMDRVASIIAGRHISIVIVKKNVHQFMDIYCIAHQ